MSERQPKEHGKGAGPGGCAGGVKEDGRPGQPHGICGGGVAAGGAGQREAKEGKSGEPSGTC